MEATALSLGKAVLDGALGYAKSMVAEEIALQLGIEGDVAFIADELEMMKSFLMTADEEQDKHPVLMTWVKQVREVSYNVEDSLMDFSVHSDKGLSCWWCMPLTLWERRNIAKEVKELRVKIEDVSNRNLRYRLIKGSGSKRITAEEQASIATVAMSGVNEATRTAMAQEGSVVDLGQLITNEDEDCSVIAVCGASGDMRRTTAIQDVYDDLAVRAIFGFYAWIKLVHPFNPRDFIRSLARQYYENFLDLVEEPHKRKTKGISAFMKMESMSESEMFDVVDTKVSDNRYLVVVDDLSTKQDWDCIKQYLPDNKNGSRVIISTQHQEIASLCVAKKHQVSRLKQFSSDPCLCLLHKKVMPLSDNIATTSSSTNTVVTSENVAVSNSEIQIQENEGGEKVSDPTARKKFERSRTMAHVNELLGRATEKSKLIELVQDEQGFRAISVWGMGGLGKTSLVRSVYRSPLLSDWKRAWATALHPFNREQVIKRIAADLLGETQTEKIEELKIEELTPQLKRFFEKEKCLVVLDDISSTKEWDSIYHECLKYARRIIVTTREKSIAKHCSGVDQNMCNLSGLSDDIALDLFKKEVFKHCTEKKELLPEMIKQGRLILKKCKGLPLAISTIGSFLATKPKTVAQWRKTYDRISSEFEINRDLRTVKTVLVRSYDGLPYDLKSCFLYMSIFPEDHKIRREHVIKRWIAEGYTRERHGMTAEEVGDNDFEELLDRSMILPGDEVSNFGGKIDSCQLHDIMRQICIAKAREENLCFTLEDGSNLSSTRDAIRHLAISSNWERDEGVFKSVLDLSHLRSLTVFGKLRPFLISKKMRFLRVLDLDGAVAQEDDHLDQIAELIHLKYLSLGMLAKNIRKEIKTQGIQQIQYSILVISLIDPEASRVCPWLLPASFANLQKLQFLRASSGLIITRVIGKLSALCTLDNVKAYKTGEHTLNDFRQLHKLRELGIEGISETNSKEFWSAIASLNQLRSLSVQSSDDKLDYFLDGVLSPPRSC